MSNYHDPSTTLAQVVTILLLNALTILAYTLALVAYYKNRHHPGFVPEEEKVTSDE